MKVAPEFTADLPEMLGLPSLEAKAAAIVWLHEANIILNKTAAEMIAAHTPDCRCTFCVSIRYSQRNAPLIPDRRRPDSAQGAQRHSRPTGAWAEFLEGR